MSMIQWRSLTVNVKDKTCRVDVEIDWTEAEELARKAAQNKTQRSKDGPMRAKVVWTNNQ